MNKKILMMASLMVFMMSFLLVSVNAGEVHINVNVDGEDWNYNYQAFDGLDPGVWPDYVPTSGLETVAVWGSGSGNGDFDSQLNIVTGNSIDVTHEFEATGSFNIQYQGSAVWAEDTERETPQSGFVDMAQGNFEGSGWIEGSYVTNTDSNYPTVIVTQEGEGFGSVHMSQFADAGGASSWGPSSGSTASSYINTGSYGYYNAEQSMTVQQHTYSLAGDMDYFLWGFGDKGAGFTYTQKHNAADPFQFQQNTDSYHLIFGEAELSGWAYYPVLEGDLGGRTYTATYDAAGQWGVDFTLDITTGWLFTYEGFSMERAP